MSKFLLPLSEYNRIHQVAHGVLADIANAERACTFFAAFGAFVLNKHYNIPARVVAGAFGLAVTDRPEVAFFGRIEDGVLLSDADAFHMWIQTETHIVDFMAPIYPEAFVALQTATPIPRKMLQLRLVDEAESVSALKQAGDCIACPDPDLTDELVDRFCARPHNEDLVRVADAWFGGRRARQQPGFAMIDNRGVVEQLTLAKTTANGAW